MEPDDDVVGEHSHRPLKKVRKKPFTLLSRRVSLVRQVGAAKLVSLAEQVGLASLVRLVWKLVSLSSKASYFSSWPPIYRMMQGCHLMESEWLDFIEDGKGPCLRFRVEGS